MSVIKQFSGPWTVAEGDHPFVECATFGDLIKRIGGGWQSDWHFVDIPFLDEGGSLADFPDFKLAANNLTGAMHGIVDWFNQENDYKNQFPYQIMSPKYEES